MYDEPNISSTIKENPYSSNVELEGSGKGRKGEVVLRPDGEALHDVVGKRHYAGGVETWLPEGSFVFSDFKDLAFNKRDHKLFELKEGGSYKKHDNTPAEVLRRNIDVKHYNKMSETLGNKYKDSISKNTAELMLSKYQEKLGQIALIQESKKGFPEGTPSFSQGTAPVYEDEFKEYIMEQKQYMKFGGNVLPKYQPGGKTSNNTWIDSKGNRTTTYGDRKVVDYSNGRRFVFFNNGRVWKGDTNNWENTRQPDESFSVATGTTTQPSSNKGLSGIDEEGNQRNATPSTPASPQNPYIPGSSHLEQYLPKQEQCPLGYYKDKNGKCVPFQKPAPEPLKGEVVSQVEAGAPSPVEMPWTFTPWQKYSMGQGFKNYASINRLMPMRSKINSPLVELERMVEPSYLGELASGFRANQVMNPYLAGVNNAQMYGKMLDADRQSIAQNINANNQIANQQNLMNNQIQRQDLQTNIGADQQYYNQVQQSKGNFDNLRSAVREQNRGELTGNVQANEQLAMAMARMGKDRPFDYNFRTGQIWHTGKGDIMPTPVNNSEFQELLKMIQGISDPTEKAKQMLKLYGLKTFQQPQMRTQQKMGGYNPYRR